MAKCADLYHTVGAQQILRALVPVHLKCWSVPYDGYSPVRFSLDFNGKDWADPLIGSPGFNPQWNAIDGKIDRRSHSGPYRVIDGYPLNPSGRTGICDRGKLGKWGPNHAGDAIVTRWKRDHKMEKIVDKNSGRPVLQFVAIQRRDTKQWAVPGGMVDAGEIVASTVLREFCEEALNSLTFKSSEKEMVEKKLKTFFESCGVEVYKGVVDDPRNTDNAWMETVAYNFHDESGDIVNNFNFSAGDDAIGVRWLDVHRALDLYANHILFIEKTANRLTAHW